MSIITGYPLEVLLYQQGQIGQPLSADAAAGADRLDTAQRSITIGEPVPIVFGRRRNDGTGGVLISPGASEARFENDETNAVTASYRLVLSEGELDGIQVRDVFQRSCRVGSFSQAHELRAGTWTPGNFIVQQGELPKPECPYYCGTGGSYEGITTASFVITAPPDDDRWNRQVHLFIRGGMHVTRLLDATYGPSDNFADLVLWLIQRSSRVPAELIDTATFTAAATFTDANGLHWDGVLQQSYNLEDFLATFAPYLLLSKAKRGGKIGLRALLPTTEAGAIDTDPITPATLFDESRVAPDSFEISWIPAADRRPVCLLMLWRQQPEDDLGLIRTTEVRYAGTAEDGPYEQHDLSLFCTSEEHAVKVGAYILARRRYITHTLRIRARPSSINQALTRGDIVQVNLQRKASSAPAAVHNYFYEIDRISKARSGELTFELVHFPIDETSRSLVALDVAAVRASGVLLPTGIGDALTCDENSSEDETVPEDDTLDPVDFVDEYGAGGGLEAGGDGFSGGALDGLPVLDGSGGTGGGGDGAGGGVGGGDESTGGGGSGGGVSEGSDPDDAQDPDPYGAPPPGIAIGGSVSPGFLSGLNSEINKFEAGVFEFDFSGNGYGPNATWTIEVSATSRQISGALTLISTGNVEGGIGTLSGGGSVTVTSLTSQVSYAPAHGSTKQYEDGGANGVFAWQHAIFLAPKIGVSLYRASLAGKPTAVGYAGGLLAGNEAPASLYSAAISYPSGRPEMYVVSMTRTA